MHGTKIVFVHIVSRVLSAAQQTKRINIKGGFQPFLGNGVLILLKYRTPVFHLGNAHDLTIASLMSLG